MARINAIGDYQIPSKPYDVSYVYECLFSGVHKPILFKFARLDYPLFVISYTNNAGFTQVVSSLTNCFDDVALGQIVYLTYYDGGVVVLVKRGVVTSIIDNENFVTDIPYVSAYSNSGSINIYERGWYLKTILNITYPTVETIEIESTFDEFFNVIVNVAPFLKRYINNTYLLENFPSYGDEVLGMAVSYKVDIIPMAFDYDYDVNGWVFAGNLFTLNSTEFTGLNGVKQIQSKFGNNYADYYGTDYTLTSYLHNLFIAENPTYFVGLPFWYGYTFKGYGGYRIKPHYVRYNQNGGLISGLVDLEITAGRLLNVSINSSLIVSGTKTITLQLFYHNSSDTLQYEKSKLYIIDVVELCDFDGIYLTWLASDGSRYFWNFEKRFVKNLTTKTVNDFTPYYEDIEVQGEVIRDIEVQANENYTVGTYVAVEKFNWIKSILHSVNVQMLMNANSWEVDGAIWQTIRIGRGNVQLQESDDRLIDLSFDFDLPEINIQSE